MSTVGEELDWAREKFQPLSDTPYLDAQVLLSHVMEVPRSWLLAHPEARVLPEFETAFRRDAARYRRGEALPYILGWWEFYGRRFRVTPEVLIPRPETELLVEIGLERLWSISQSPQVLDVGTGSGCIAISLAAERSEACVVAVDISLGALRVAQENARWHGVSDRVHILQADLTAPLSGRFDLLCANLPYIPSGRLHDLKVGRREPHLALDGGPKGVGAIRRLLATARLLMKSKGRILLEISPEQHQGVLAYVDRETPLSLVKVHQDLAGHDRLIELGVGGQGA
jgi:release factor glutamine methyltransferase